MGNLLPEICSNQGSMQYFAEKLLLLRGELLPLRCEVEGVDGLVAFGVDQRDFDVASQARHRRADLVEQSGMVLRDDFEQRAVRR